MAPRRTAVKTAQSAAETFDFDAFLADFRRPEFKATLIRRTDLAPELASRVRVLDELDEAIERLEKAEGEEGAERDITEASTLSGMIRRRQTLTEAYNDMANEYNASAVEFTFRVPDQKDDHVRIQALMDETGLEQPAQPETDGMPPEEAEKLRADYEAKFEIWWDALAIRSMSVTCTKHPGTDMGAPPLTVEQWTALRDRVGPLSFNDLGQAWFQAVQAAAPSAPFSPRPLPSPINGE